MKKETGNIAFTVRKMILPIAEELGYSVWDVEFVKEGASRYLRITIDSPNGITVDDCEKMNDAVDPILDEADLIKEQYYLEITSPGVEREIKTDEHIEKCTGWDVELKLYAPMNGSKSFRGILEGLCEDKICISVGTEKMYFERGAVAKINAAYDF